MPEVPISLSQLPPPWADAIVAILEHAEKEIEAGHRLTLAFLLSGFEGTGRPTAVWELLGLDCSSRGRCGQELAESAYLEQLPDDAATVRAFFADRQERRAAWPSVPGYTILGEVARTLMSVVYWAVHQASGQEVALKMVLPDLRMNRVAVQRFQDQIDILKSLDHPHVIRIIEGGEYEGKPFFTMPFINGGTLAASVAEFARPRDGKQVSSEELYERSTKAARLLATVARAVHAMHQAGVIHRDLKPSNILIDDQGEPLVADLGLAARTAQARELTLSGEVLGTYLYMAPEQARGEKPVRVLVDVYSLGAILYKLLTGRCPFEAPTVAQLLEQLTDENLRPQPPSGVNPLLKSRAGSAQEAVCLKCLEKKPADRYQSAEELARDLDACAEGRKPAAQKSWSWVRAVLQSLTVVAQPPRPIQQVVRYVSIDVGVGLLGLAFHALIWTLLRGGATVETIWLVLFVYVFVDWALFLLCLFRLPVLPSLEKDMLAAWVACTFAEVALLLAYCPPLSGRPSGDILRFYPALAAITGMVLFIEGRLYWGRLYGVAVVYFLLGPLLPLTGPLAPLVFGTVHAVLWIWLGLYRARQARHSETTAELPTVAWRVPGRETGRVE